MGFSPADIAVALIAFAFAPTLGQDTACTDVFFSVSRHEERCQDFFVCMIGQRVDFSCDAGQIFHERSIECRAGDAETCVFDGTTIPDDECIYDFLRISPHPDEDQCWAFFVCLNYNIIHFNCDYGYIFSSTELRCVSGSHTTCEEGGLSPFQNEGGHSLTSFQNFAKFISPKQL